MTLPVGSDAWLQAWSAPQRTRTVELARRRVSRLTRWIVASLAGVVLGLVTIAAGQPAVDGLPPAPTVPMTVALAVDAAALAASRAGWRAVAAVFTNRAPASVLRSVRTRTALAALVALLASLFGICWGAVVPVADLLDGPFGWTDGTTLLLAVLNLAAGIAAMRLWVNLLRVQSPTEHR